MIEKLQPGLDAFVASLALLLGYLLPAGVVRTIYHLRLVRLGHRRVFDRAALIELPVACFGAWVGVGIARYFEMPEQTIHGVVAVVAWFGPVGLQALLQARLEKLGLIPPEKTFDPAQADKPPAK